MFTPRQLEEAEAAIFAANAAKTQMDEAATAFEAAQRTFNQATRIAELVFGPTPEECIARKEFLASPLGEFMKAENERLVEVYGQDIAADVRFEDLAKAFDVREKLARQLPKKTCT